MSEAEIVFYHNPMSRSRIARWALEEIGQPYRTEILDYGPPMKSPAYLAINPLGKVPAIIHRGMPVCETAAICAYLADAFPQSGLAPPPGDPARGAYYRWLFFAAGPIEQAGTMQALGFTLPEGKERMAGYGSLKSTLDAVEGAVSAGEYLAGGGFSMADLYLASHLDYGMRFGMVEKRPGFLAYVGRLTEREACRRATELDGPMPG